MSKEDRPTVERRVRGVELGRRWWRPCRVTFSHCRLRGGTAVSVPISFLCGHLGWLHELRLFQNT